MTADAYLTWPPPPAFDARPVPGTSRDVFNMEQVRAHIEKAIESRRYSGTTDPVEYLVQRRCMVPADREHAEQATLTGILCFAKDPQAIFSNAVVDIGHYQGTEPLTYEMIDHLRNIGGSIFDQIAVIEEYLLKNTRSGQALAKGSFKARQILQYPEYVLRELSINMLAHRDYANDFSVPQVRIFRNRIVWSNPGGLLPGVRLDNILRRHAARNRVLLQILFDAGYVEAFGQGLDTVVHVLQQEGMSPPDFDADDASFTVTVYGRQLDMLYGDGAYADLRESQRQILSVIFKTGEATIQDLEGAIPERPRRSLQRDLQGLQERNLIYTIGKGRAARYRIKEDHLEPR